MLTGIGLRNFKAFGDEMQEAPLSKITLIYGPNSGGKSSIIQALLLLKQSLKNKYPDGNAYLLPRGQFADLGGIQALMHRHEVSRELAIRFKYRKIELEPFSTNNTVHLKFSNHFGTCRLSGIHFTVASPYDGKVYDDREVPKEVVGPSVFEEGSIYRGPFEFFLTLPTRPDLVEARERLLNDPELKMEWPTQEKKLRDALLFARHAPKYLQKELPKEELLVTLPESIPSEFEEHLQSINYLGPLRSAPSRLYRTSSEIHSPSGITGTHGEFSARVIYHNQGIKESVNDWFEQFEIPYALDVRELGEASLAGEHITIALTDKRTDTQVTLADVGYGINQILPVIIEGVASREGSILCVEQPEIHLHPRLQANIADLMIDTIADEPGKRKQWIVETHSELLITRLQRRIREGKIKSADISVLYVDPDAEYTEGSAIIPLRMDENGDFMDRWPHGFFDEAFNELMAEPDSQVQPAD